jgi:hypothetical protein
VRAFFYVKRKQDTLWFKKENEFILLPKVLFDNPETAEIIEVLEDSIIWAFSAEFVKQLCDTFAEFHGHIGTMVMLDWVSSDRRIKLGRLPLGSDKYDWLRQHFPSLMDRAPVKHLAAFLGISEKEFRHLHKSKIKLHLALRKHKRDKGL